MAYKVVLVRVRDLAGGHPWDARGGRNSHNTGRHDYLMRRSSRAEWESHAFPALVRCASTTRRGPYAVAGGQSFKKGDHITVYGSTGQVLAGKVDMVQPELSGEFATLIGWADKVRRLGVRLERQWANGRQGRGSLWCLVHRALSD